MSQLSMRSYARVFESNRTQSEREPRQGIAEKSRPHLGLRSASGCSRANMTATEKGYRNHGRGAGD